MSETHQSTTPKPDAESLLKYLLQGSQIHIEFATALRREFKIDGASIEELEQEYKIPVPEVLDPATCRSLERDLLRLYQKVAQKRARARATASALRNSTEAQFRGRFAALTLKYQDTGSKLPAQKTLETLVQNELSNLESAKVAAEIEEGFWEDIQDYLAWCRKVLEDAIMASGVEAKLNREYR